MMANEAERIMKMDKCLSVRFHAKDKDGDTVFVEVEGKAAQELLDYIQQGLQGSSKINLLRRSS